MMIRKHLFIKGVVQGVFYRASTRKEAERVGVTGWVRNLSDGRVEAVFEGEDEEVKRMEEFCWQGPPQAEVEDIQIFTEEPEGLDRFEVL